MKKCFLTILLLSFLITPALAGDVTFSSPAGGEKWVKGSTRTIAYTYNTPMADDCVTLLRNGAFVGYIFHSAQTHNAGSAVSHSWEVGKLMDLDDNVFWAPSGSGYTIRAGQMAQAHHGGFSNPFSITPFDLSGLIKIKTVNFEFSAQAGPDGCPQCLVLDLAGIRDSLLRSVEPLAAGLYWQGRQAAELGRIGQGRGFAAKLQVKLGADALAAAKRGEEFELRLFGGRGQSQLLHSQSIRLQLARR